MVSPSAHARALRRCHAGSRRGGSGSRATSCCAETPQQSPRSWEGSLRDVLSCGVSAREHCGPLSIIEEERRSGRQAGDAAPSSTRQTRPTQACWTTLEATRSLSRSSLFAATGRCVASYARRPGRYLHLQRLVALAGTLPLPGSQARAPRACSARGGASPSASEGWPQLPAPRGTDVAQVPCHRLSTAADRLGPTPPSRHFSAFVGPCGPQAGTTGTSAFHASRGGSPTSSQVARGSGARRPLRWRHNVSCVLCAEEEVSPPHLGARTAGSSPSRG